MTDWPHDFDPDVSFCKRCGVALEIVFDHRASEECHLFGQNVSSLRCFAAKKQMAAFVDAVMANFTGNTAG
jgi:hypothetical protein